MEIKEFISILGEVFEDTDLFSITPETNFCELEEWSSLSTLSLIALADEKFDKEISGSDIKNAKTIQDLFNLIVNK